MNIHARRAIAFFFIIGFLIATPLLILHTAGYRYSWKKQKVSKAGSLVLETKPKGANIYLNNELIDGTTPIRLTDIFPNEYQVTIEKDGYYSWQKKLTVNPQKTTFAESIVLFKQSQPQLINNEKIEQAWLAADKQNIIYSTSAEQKKQIKLFSTDNQNTTLLLEFEAGKNIIDKIQINHHSNYIVIYLLDQQRTLPPQIYIVNMAAPDQILNLNTLLAPRTIHNLIWSWDKNNTFYFLDETDVIQAQIQGQQIDLQTVYNFQNFEKVNDFTIINNYLYYLQENSQAVYFKKINLNNIDEINSQIQLGFSKYIIKDFIDNKLLIGDSSKKEILLVNLELDNVLMNQKDINGYEFNQKQNKLLTYSDTEIAITDFNNYPFDSQLITRVSGSITYADWFKENNNYIYCIKNNQINLIELDERDIRNTLTLLPININIVVLDANEQNFYFTYADQPGIFSLKIID